MTLQVRHHALHRSLVSEEVGAHYGSEGEEGMVAVLWSLALCLLDEHRQHGRNVRRGVVADVR